MIKAINHPHLLMVVQLRFMTIINDKPTTCEALGYAVTALGPHA
jgi:hypothetical protein